MKIAFCLFKYFPYGGLQRDFIRIARACRQRGHEVHAYTMKWEGELEPELGIHILPAKGWQNHTRSHAFAENVKTELDKERPDVVVGFNKMPYLDVYYAADVCFQSRVRLQHGFLYRLLPRYRRLVALEKSIFASGKQTEIMLISAKQEKEFVHYYKTEANRFHLLPPGVSKDRVAAENAGQIRQWVRKQNHIAEDDFLLLMVGSGFKTKGLDRAIRSLADLPSELRKTARLLVIGDDKSAEFKKLANKLNIGEQVQFLGGRFDVPDFLLAADILLHPAYHENTGTVLLEAMISGLPVLTTDVCGYAHYIKEAKAGEVLPSPFKQAEFNITLQKMLLSSHRSEWKKNGLAFAERSEIYSLPERAADLIEKVGTVKFGSTTKEVVAINDLDFNQMMALRGECFRHQKGRLTQRIELGDKSYFIKQHTGIGWKEILKNLLQLRWPVLSAKNEIQAIEKLQSLGVAVPLVSAYGQRGMNPARLQSFILMDELAPVISLEDLCKSWLETPPSFALKRKLLEEVARIARILHQGGINHRDFYICHFLLDTTTGLDKIDDNNIKLYLIDLHRAQIRSLTPKRWIIKDLSGLYFSSKGMGLTQRDLYRFMRVYKTKSLRETLKPEINFWQKVKARGERLYSDHT